MTKANTTTDFPLHVEGADEGLTAEQLDSKYNPGGGGEHPTHTRGDWRAAVANKDTILGYWEWLEEQIREECDNAYFHGKDQN